MSKQLDWDNMPPAGTEVVFKGFSNEDHTHWSYTEGKVYTLEGTCAGVRPVANNGAVPSRNWGFIFEIVEDTPSFNVGDRVVLSTESEFHVAGSYGNPINTGGTITEVNEGHLEIYVDWDNDTHNCYNAEDLVLVAGASEGSPEGHSLVDGTSSSEYTVGDKFVVKDTRGMDGSYNAGDIATLYDDDESEMPMFKMKKDGGRQFIYWSNLEAYGGITLTEGDYTTREMILQYAEDNGLSVEDVYQQLCDAFVNAGADVGEGVVYWNARNLPNYGWYCSEVHPKGCCYFSTTPILFTRLLTPEQILGTSAGNEEDHNVAPEDVGDALDRAFTEDQEDCAYADEEYDGGWREHRPEMRPKDTISSMVITYGETTVEVESISVEGAVALIRELKS